MSRHEPPIWQDRRPSLIGTLFKCLTVIAVAGIGCATGIAIRGINMVDGRVSGALSVVGQAITDFPRLMQELPPAVADMLHDRREPGYARQVTVSARVVSRGEDEERISYRGRVFRDMSGGRAAIEIKNSGDEVVTLLALRAVSLDEEGEPMCERIVYGATPVAVEDEWRGPIYPGSTRRIAVHCASDAANVEVEIADLRVWSKAADETTTRGG